MNTKPRPVTQTDFRSQLGHQVAAFCLTRGYAIADTYGRVLDYDQLTSCDLTSVIGLLYDNPAQASEPRRFFGLIKPRKLRRVFLGKIWLRSTTHETSDKYWVFDVYGRGNIKRAYELARELSVSFEGVEIRIDLLQDQPKTEAYTKDFWD